MVMEELPFFFQPEIAIDLGEVNNFEGYVAKEFYYRGTSIGLQKTNRGQTLRGGYGPRRV